MSAAITKPANYRDLSTLYDKIRETEDLIKVLRGDIKSVRKEIDDYDAWAKKVDAFINRKMEQRIFYHTARVRFFKTGYTEKRAGVWEKLALRLLMRSVNADLPAEKAQFLDVRNLKILSLARELSDAKMREKNLRGRVDRLLSTPKEKKQ